jgi:tetratricopeptide (TPR) repeat protein
VEEVLLAHLGSGHSQNGLICEALAKGYLHCYRLRDVVRCAARWQRLEPSSWQPPFYCGRALELHNNHDEAIEQFRAALALKPDSTQVRFRLANVLARVSKFPEAQQCYETCLRAEPTHLGALLGVAYCQHCLGWSEEALATLDRLAALDGHNSGADYLRGRVELQLERPLQALDSVLKAKALKPHDPEIIYALAQCLRELQRNEDVDRYAKEVEHLQSEQKRIADLKDAIAAKPRDISLRHDVGRYFQGFGQYLDAIRWYQSILQIDPSDRSAHESLAACFERIGDPARAALHRKAASGAIP